MDQISAFSGQNGHKDEGILQAGDVIWRSGARTTIKPRADPPPSLSVRFSSFFTTKDIVPEEAHSIKRNI